MPSDAYSDRCAVASQLMREAVQSSCRLGLNKTTSNLFRPRTKRGKRLLDLRGFRHVLRVDEDSRTANVEGMVTYEAFVDATLRHGLLPAVVPELKTITVGGAVSGLGIESSSFRFGLVHETVEEMDVLLGNGEIVRCSPQLEPDLFYAIPNSYGTLGYILRLRTRLTPAPPLIHLRHHRFTGLTEYFQALSHIAQNPSLLYVDGTIFSASDLYITTGSAEEHPQATSDYSGMQPYYKSIRTKNDDWLAIKAYIWRWDTDWFWCSSQFHLDHPILRFLLLPGLGSKTYQRMMRWSRMLPSPDGTESVIQDAQVPIEQAAEFATFVLGDIGISPVWTCPFRTLPHERTFDLCPLEPGALYVNLGFWDVIPVRGEPGVLNRAVEQKALACGGLKALYSRCCYDSQTFSKIFDVQRYEALRRKYHASVFPDLYSKCVLRA